MQNHSLQIILAHDDGYSLNLWFLNDTPLTFEIVLPKYAHLQKITIETPLRTFQIVVVN